MKLSKIQCFLLALPGLLICLLSTPAWSQGNLWEPTLWEPKVVLWSSQGGSLEEMAKDWPGFSGLRGEVDAEVTTGTGKRGRRWREVSLYCAEASWVNPVAEGEEASPGGGKLALGALSVRLRRNSNETRAHLWIDLVGPVAKTVHAEFDVDAEINLLAGKIDWGEGFLDGLVTLEGVKLDLISEAFPLFALEGEVDGSMKVTGPPTWPIIEAEVTGESLRWRGQEAGRWNVRWGHRGRSSTFDVAWGPVGEPWALVHTRVPVLLDLKTHEVKWLDAESHALRVESRGLTPAKLRPFWRAHPAADFVLHLSGYGEGTLDSFWFKAEAHGELLDQGRRPLAIEGKLRVEPEKQTLNFSLGDKVLRVNLDASAPLAQIRRAGARWEDVTLGGEVSTEIPFETLAPYMPEGVYNPRGRLVGQADIGGTLGLPSWDGEVSSERASMTLVGLNSRLRQMKFKAKLKGQDVKIETLEAASGLGRCVGTGQASLVMTPPKHDPATGFWGQWRLESSMHLELERFPLMQDGIPGGLIDGGANLSLEAIPGETRVVIKTSPIKVSLIGDGLPPALSIPVNRAVRRLDWTGSVQSGDSVLLGEGRLMVDLDLRESVHLEGEGFLMDLGGRMQIDRQDDQATVEGGFEAVPGGEFSLFENRFEVIEGSLTMAGGNLDARDALDPTSASYATLHDPSKPATPVPLEPLVEFVARGKAAGTYVLVKVLGPARRPRLVLLSSPPLPEYQIMTLLITGRVDSVDSSNGEVRRQVASLVNRFHNPSLARQLYDRLGVDKLGLGFGSSVSQPILTVGKQFNRQLYFETIYHHNAPPEENEKEGHVEYRLSPHWTMDTVFGDAAQGSFGLFWQTRFGGPPPPEPPREWLEPEEEEEEEEEGPVEPAQPSTSVSP